jgi:hypothetical protein
MCQYYAQCKACNKDFGPSFGPPNHAKTFLN